MSALRVAFAGTPEFARAALQAVLRSEHSIVSVFTRPDRPRGRGQKLAASAVKAAALAARLPVFAPESLAGAAVLDELKSSRPDILIVVAYGLILPPAWLRAPRLGCVNIHASLLPRWRGAAPIQRALLAGDTRTGITIMQMEAGLDSGPILLQRPIGIGATDTSGSLHDELAELGARTLLEALEGLSDGRLAAVPQPAEGVSYAAKIAKSEAAIDWRRSAVEIDRQVRAFNPWPIAETRLAGEQLRIAGARVADPHKGAGDVPSPGTVLAMREDALEIQCGEGSLAVTQVQRPGRRAVAARDFALGRTLVGELLG